jgi:hypothetical protein
MVLVLTAGQRHERVAFERVMEQEGSVKRAGCARQKIRPRRICADKSYSSKEIRGYLRRRRGIRITIPRKTNEWSSGPFDREIYRRRNRIERLIN